MRMNQNERRFDFHGLGLALKKAREEKGWTQAYVAELVDRDSRTIMNIENKGQYPSFNLFVKLITMFDISVDQFIHTDGGEQTSPCRKHIDVGSYEIIVAVHRNDPERNWKVVSDGEQRKICQANGGKKQKSEPFWLRFLLFVIFKG